MIVVAGSANLDFVVRAGHIPAPGETVLGHSFQSFPGGKGANQAVACARSGGAATTFLAALGDDDYAQPLLASLYSAGVAVQRVASPQPTGTAFICVSAAGENAITVAPGANADLRPEHWPSDVKTTHLLMQLETPLPTVLAFAQAARQAGTEVVLNAAPAQHLPPELLRCVDVLIVNEGELAVLASHAEGEQALRSLAAPHGIATIIVTLGAQGCLALHQGEILRQAAFPVQVTDTTAAGDTFCGSLVAALAGGANLPAALRQACAASALACTVLGAQSSIPTRAQVQEFLASRA